MRQAQPRLHPARHASPHVIPEDLGTVSAVALVEGPSDAAALHALARRQGRDLGPEGVVIVAMGGATNIGRHLQELTSTHPELRLGGLCDADEERAYRRGLERVGLCTPATRDQMERLGFYVCDVDLEDELIRALGTNATLEVLERTAMAEKFKLYQRQPAHREEPLETQLRGFVTNWKVDYATVFVDALDLAAVPRPLAALLASL